MEVEVNFIVHKTGREIGCSGEYLWEAEKLSKKK